MEVSKVIIGKAVHPDTIGKLQQLCELLGIPFNCIDECPPTDPHGVEMEVAVGH